MVAPSLSPQIAVGSVAPIVSEEFNASVVRVVDDSTLIVHRFDKDKDETVTLFGVKTVNVTAPDGKSSRDYLTAHLKNARVRVEARSRDKAGTVSALVTLVPPRVPRFEQQPDASGLGSNLPTHTFASAITPQPTKTINETIIGLGSGALRLPSGSRRRDAGKRPGDRIEGRSRFLVGNDRDGFLGGDAGTALTPRPPSLPVAGSLLGRGSLKSMAIFLPENE